jgi:hypothetical protein
MAKTNDEITAFCRSGSDKAAEEWSKLIGIDNHNADLNKNYLAGRQNALSEVIHFIDNEE